MWLTAFFIFYDAELQDELAIYRANARKAAVDEAKYKAELFQAYTASGVSEVYAAEIVFGIKPAVKQQTASEQIAAALK